MGDPAEPKEFLTVRELADLLRVKERKVYDLAASGEVPCSRATGKLLFPVADVRSWINAAKSGGSFSAPRPPIVLGSHDPLLDWAMRESQSGLATYFDGSLDGLERFCSGEGIAAGVHLFDPVSESWNVRAVSERAGDQNAVLIEFASRRRGLVVAEDVRLPSGLDDLASLRLIARQEGSGADTLFRALLERDGIDFATIKTADVARTEYDAVEALRRGDGDVTFGLEAEAASFGLRFAPIVDERYSLLVDRHAYFEPSFQSLLGFCLGDVFRKKAATFGGYDVTDFGRVVWNA